MTRDQFRRLCTKLAGELILGSWDDVEQRAEKKLKILKRDGRVEKYEVELSDDKGRLTIRVFKRFSGVHQMIMLQLNHRDIDVEEK